jgi:DHA1 family inner membrane transport protein
VLHRALDASYPAEVHQRITLLTVARTAANSCFRFAPPFLATVASDLDVSFGTIGVAVAISELSGLLSPATGTVAERLHRRTALFAGLIAVALASLLAASSQHLVMFGVALVLLAQGKVLFDLGLGAWVSDRVPYERRGRVIGLTETSWALGLLVGVTAMGLITAATSWRVAYVAGALVVVTLAGAVWRAVDDDPPGHRDARAETRRPKITRPMWVLAAGGFCLMGASQMLFVTFGKWMRDEFDFSDATVAIVAFLLGFGELFSSLAAARQSDRWGKEVAGAVGAAIMIPATMLLAIGQEELAIGLPALIIAIAAFEFAIVSIIPLGTHLVPGAPAFGMAIMFATGTFGRAVASIPATRTYERWGMAAPALMAGTLAVGTIVALLVIRGMRACQR